MRRAYTVLAILCVVVAISHATAAAQDDEDPDVTAEKLFREGVDLFAIGKYEAARLSFAKALRLDPKAKEVWKWVKMAGDAAMIRMMADPRMGRAPGLIWDLYRLHQNRLIRDEDLIRRLVKIAIDPLKHPHDRWKSMERLNQVGQFVIPFLVDALGDDRNHEVRSFARVTATAIGPKATLPVIELLNYRAAEGADKVDVLRAELVRQNAALILGDLDDKRALAALKRASEDEKELDIVRKYCLISLRKISGLDIRDLLGAQDYYYLQADRYLRELAGVASEALEADGVIWKLVDGKLVDYQVPRFAWNELMAEQACYRSMEIDPTSTACEAIYPLFAETVASEIAEIRELLDVALERRYGRPFTEEEISDVRSREKKLLMEPLALVPSALVYASAPDMPVPRLELHRNLLLCAMGPANIYRAIDKSLDDAEQDRRELPKLAACVLADMAATLDPDGALLPRPGEAPKRGKRGRRGRGAEATEGAPLIRALSFPDKRVRYAAAIALARMNPPMPFQDADKVASTLARAIGEKGPLHVLLVEEDASVRNEIIGKLRELDIGVSFEETAYEGRLRAIGFPPVDVILVSPTLARKGNTPELLKMLRADARSRPLPTAIITTYANREEHKKAFKAHENVKGYVPVEDSGKDLRDLIGKIAEQRAHPIMSKKRSEELAVEAAEALCQIHPHLTLVNHMMPEDAADACIAALHNRPDVLRRPCIDMLGRFKIAKAADKVLGLLRDAAETEVIRIAAARAIGRILAPESAAHLRDIAGKKDEKHIIRYDVSRGYSDSTRGDPRRVSDFLKALRVPYDEKHALPRGVGEFE